MPECSALNGMEQSDGVGLVGFNSPFARDAEWIGGADKNISTSLLVNVGTSLNHILGEYCPRGRWKHATGVFCIRLNHPWMQMFMLWFLMMGFLSKARIE